MAPFVPVMVRVTTHCPGVRPVRICVLQESAGPNVTTTSGGGVAEGMVTESETRLVPLRPANPPANERVLEAVLVAMPPKDAVPGAE